MIAPAWTYLLVLLAGASPTPAPLASDPAPSAPCGGVALERGRVVTAGPIVPGEPGVEDCLAAIGTALKRRPELRSVTLALQVPDGKRAPRVSLEKAEALADLLARGGLERSRVSVVLPPTEAGAREAVAVSYVETVPARAVGWLRTVEGEVFTGAGVAPRPLRAGDVVFTGMWLRTPEGGAAELVSDAGDVVRMLSGTSVYAEAVPGAVQLRLERGALEIEAGPGQASLRVRTRAGIVAARPSPSAVFRLTENECTRIEVDEGALTLEGAKRMELGEGFVASIRDGAFLGPRPMSAAPERARGPQGSVPAPGVIRWEPVTGAATYLVEVARDAEFRRERRRSVSAVPEARLSGLEPGKWFWRVSAQDSEGASGRRSQVLSFEVPGAQAR